MIRAASKQKLTLELEFFWKTLQRKPWHQIIILTKLKGKIAKPSSPLHVYSFPLFTNYCFQYNMRVDTQNKPIKQNE